MAATETERKPGGHRPVLLTEVLEVLAPRDGGIYLDGTFGAGGYSRAILEAADCRVFAIDQDPMALAAGQALAERFDGRLTLLPGRFGDMESLLGSQGLDKVDGIALDVGVSSMQIDQPERGFSFQADGPLDMRMNPESGESAADVVNGLAEAELADIIKRYGEERRARAVARAIVAARSLAPITRTLQLAAVIRRVVRASRDDIDPSTRTFQALRIYVNDELGELERALEAAEKLLATGGCLAVVSFHSLEDKVVKTFLRDRSGKAPGPSRHEPPATGRPRDPSFELLTSKARRPGEAECAGNPRARSARLRAARRSAAPAWSDPTRNHRSGNKLGSGAAA